MIVRVRGVKKARAKGRIYYYHRATGTRLPDRSDPAFLDIVNRLDAAVTARNAVSADTLGALIRKYKASPEWAAFAKATHTQYNDIFNWLKPIDELPLIQLDKAFLYGLRDRAMKAHKRGFANGVLKNLQALWNWGQRRDLCHGVNPVLGVERIKRPRNAPVKNRPWRPEELDTVLAAAPPPVRIAVALAAYAGLRESDVVRTTWAYYDGQAIETRQQKTGHPVWVPAHYRLREILDAAPRLSPVIIIGERGQPYTKDVLRTRFFRLIGKLKSEGKIGTGLSFHGLRHTLGTWLAEAGCDAQTIASILGQQTSAMAEHYSRTANRRGNATAAIEKLERKDRGS